MTGWRPDSQLNRAFLAVCVCILTTGCINVVPSAHLGQSESSEAANLAKILRRLAPKAKDLLLEERTVANELKVGLEVTANKDPVGFRTKLRSYYDSFIEIRDKRRQIREEISQGSWAGAYVFAVQQDAMLTLQDSILRTEDWIQAAHNVQLRADLGQTTGFPELTVLRKQLDAFLLQVVNDPLSDQIRELQEEFQIGLGK